MSIDINRAKAEVRGYLEWALPDIQRDPDANRDWRRIVAQREAFSLRVTKLADGTPAVRPAWDEERGEALVARARHGDPAAHRALLVLADGWVNKHPLPPALALYVRDGWRGQGPKLKRGSEPNEDRARHIVAAVQRILDLEIGLEATRNPAARRPSACALVTETLADLGVNLSERTIEEYWGDRVREDEIY